MGASVPTTTGPWSVCFMKEETTVTAIETVLTSYWFNDPLFDLLFAAQLFCLTVVLMLWTMKGLGWVLERTVLKDPCPLCGAPDYLGCLCD